MLGVGLFSWFSYDLPIEERLRLIKNAGFDATSLWWKGEDKHLQPEMARKLGLQIDNIHAPFDNPNSLWVEGSDGEAYLEMLISCVYDCKEHGIPVVVIHLTSFTESIGTSQIGLNRIKRLVYLAEQNKVKLAFENLNYLQHLDFIFCNIDSEHIGFCYDSGHENWNHPSADCLSLYGDRLLAVHIDDNFGDEDTHLLPFDGAVEWTNTMSKLKSCRNIDYLTLEVDFKRKHEKSMIYENLTAQEYVDLAFEKATCLFEMSK